MNVSIHIEGMEELKKLVKRAPSVTAVELNRAIVMSISRIERNAKREAPVNKSSGGGTLYQGIKSFMTGRFSGVIESKAKYSLFVEDGTKPHIITTSKRTLARKPAGSWSNVSKKGYAIFGKTVHHPGTKANPYMKRGIEKSKNDINGFFKKAILNITKIL